MIKILFLHCHSGELHEIPWTVHCGSVGDGMVPLMTQKLLVQSHAHVEASLGEN